MFRRREGRGSDRNNETRVVKNLTNNAITLGDIDNFEIPAGQTRDLLKFASIQRILGLLQFRNRNNSRINSTNVYDNIIPAVLEDTKVAEAAEGATELTRNIKTVTADYMIVVDDDIVLVNTTATITLPTAAGIEGYHFIVKNIHVTGTTTVTTTGSETIDGESTKIITIQYNSLTFVSNNVNWFIL